ncbi:hypothetical protein [Teredinibacter sp. KSP-S5-2]|uniref:hypothetical protein n=1 Tax=Teredinibacter sp. KSP-S5-2 TaxID=3034506 RepID=UPI00293523AC|nr:hypothetical protein [Teredinibacter sp. KSP-S5-2]WNO11227.1 hypothetical protein P5V12_08580 [Teredinibacter sp. KSP-S5-2]
MKKIKIAIASVAFGVGCAIAAMSYADDVDTCIASNCVQGPYNFAWCVQQCLNGGF